MGDREADVLILGAGVIGLACAHYLLQAGRSVRVLDQGLAGGATSHGNCGTITPSHAPPLAAPGVIAKGLKWMLRPDAPLYIKPRLDPALASWLLHFAGRCNRADWHRSALARSELLQTSRTLLETLVREQALDCEFRASGLRYVFRDQDEFRRELAELAALREFGIESEVLDGAALAAVEPALLPGMAGAIHFPGDAHLRPERLTSELARIVRAQGGIIEEQATVTALATGKGRVQGVATSNGPRRGRDVLLALGPWSAAMLAPLGLHLPVQPGKGYSITYSRPPLVPRVPLVLREHSVCVTAWDSGFRLGSTMEFAGFDPSLNRVRLDALERAAARYLREPVGAEKREEWCGWRPMTYDDLPILGRAPGQDNLWLATGHGMMGVTLSAVTGQLLAELITGAAPSVDPASSSPLRFERGRGAGGTR
jgi:D-amino-acid dehydrogenase